MTPAPALPQGGEHGAAGQLPALPVPRRCGCCKKTRTDIGDIAMFGVLIDNEGVAWDICGKCIQVMWRKRHPRPDQM